MALSVGSLRNQGTTSAVEISTSIHTPILEDFICSGYFEFTTHSLAHLPTFDHLRDGGANLAFGNLSFHISSQGVLRLPNRTSLGPAEPSSPTTASSTWLSPTAPAPSEITSSSSSSPPSPSSSHDGTDSSTLSLLSNNSGSSDLTSYYCLDSDTSHDVESGPYFLCDVGINSTDDESDDDISAHPPSRITHPVRYQIVVVDPVTGIDDGLPGASMVNNRAPRRAGALRASTESTSITVSQADWDLSRDAIVNDHTLDRNAPQGAWDAYHAILKANHQRMKKEHAELDRCRGAVDLSSHRCWELSNNGSCNNHVTRKYKPRLPPFSKGDANTLRRSLTTRS